MFCPKCGIQLPEQGACPACGQARPALDPLPVPAPPAAKLALGCGGATIVILVIVLIVGLAILVSVLQAFGGLFNMAVGGK